MALLWDVENLNPTVRFQHDLDPEQWVELRLASEQDNKELFKKAGIKFEKKLVHNKVDRTMTYVRDLDASEAQQDRFNEEVWDFSIVEWHLLDKDEEEIPCTKDNKIMFMRRSPKFAAWIGDCLEIMREGLAVKKQEEIKN